jgi:hypothetical protein
MRPISWNEILLQYCIGVGDTNIKADSTILSPGRVLVLQYQTSKHDKFFCVYFRLISLEKRLYFLSPLKNCSTPKFNAWDMKTVPIDCFWLSDSDSSPSGKLKNTFLTFLTCYKCKKYSFKKVGAT